MSSDNKRRKKGQVHSPRSLGPWLRSWGWRHSMLFKPQLYYQALNHAKWLKCCIHVPPRDIHNLVCGSYVTKHSCSTQIFCEVQIALIEKSIHIHRSLIPLFIYDIHLLKDFVAIVPSGYSAVIYCAIISVLCAQQVFTSWNCDQVLSKNTKDKKKEKIISHQCMLCRQL